MDIKTGFEIISLSQSYRQKIHELEDASAKLDGYSYSKKVLEDNLSTLRVELQRLEDTRFQALDPIVVVKSHLGGAP